MRQFFKWLRQKLFGGYSHEELEKERASWREGVHKNRGAQARAMAQANLQRRASDKAFLVAEEVASIYRGELETQKRVGERTKEIKAKAQARYDQSKGKSENSGDIQGKTDEDEL
jgi:hypothetical protein